MQHIPLRLLIAAAVLSLAVGILTRPEASHGAVVFNVNSPADVVDAVHGDGFCSTAVVNNDVCTLRAAVQETNALAGADTINLKGITYTLSIPRAGGDLTSATGALHILDELTINGVTGSTIDGNGVVTGDRVFRVSAQNVTFNGFKIQGGRVDRDFGAGILNSGSLTVNGVTITMNVAFGDEDGGGGAIHNGSTAALTVIRSTITGNTANSGGGIQSPGTLTVRNSTISGNTALKRGGGVYTVGTTNIINSTISGNHANEHGGGIYATGGTVGLHSSTVAINRANNDADDTPGVGYGGGVYVTGGAVVTLANTIVAGNAEYVYVGPGAKPTQNPSNCYGTMLSAGNNIVPPSHLTECVVNGPSVSTANPMLGSLQNNGGPTMTYAIPAGSPAVDAGNPGGCTDNLGAPLPTDQRGYARAGSACDIGAFEYNGVAPATPTPTSSPTASPTPSPTASPPPSATTVDSSTSTPTQGATTTPTTTPTPTSSPSSNLIQGDVDCNGEIGQTDWDFLLRFAAGLNDGSTGDDCPDLGLQALGAGFPWGDVNCDSHVDAVDALFVLAHLALVDLNQQSGCTPIGSPVT